MHKQIKLKISKQIVNIFIFSFIKVKRNVFKINNIKRSKNLNIH
jgi:hypothetical protein